MRLEQLQYIMTISQLKSFNAASEQLHISQQALSQSIKNLENELSVQLFIRTSQGAYLTKQGEEVLNFAEEMWDKYTTLTQKLRSEAPSVQTDGTTLRGMLQIYASPIFSLTILPQIIKSFCKKYPKIQVNIIDTNFSAILEKLSTPSLSAYDECLGLVNVPCVKDKLLEANLPLVGYRFQPIYKGRFVLCVSGHSALGKHKTLALSTIAKQPIIQYNNNYQETSPLMSLFRYYGYTPNITLTTGDIFLWSKTIQNDVGIGLLHEAAFLPDAPYSGLLSDLVTLHCKEYIGSVIGCLAPENPSPIAQVFLDELPQNVKMV